MLRVLPPPRPGRVTGGLPPGTERLQAVPAARPCRVSACTAPARALPLGLCRGAPHGRGGPGAGDRGAVPAAGTRCAAPHRGNAPGPAPTPAPGRRARYANEP